MSAADQPLRGMSCESRARPDGKISAISPQLFSCSSFLSYFIFIVFYADAKNASASVTVENLDAAAMEADDFFCYAQSETCAG